jgi:hypothetical protein
MEVASFRIEHSPTDLALVRIGDKDAFAHGMTPTYNRNLRTKF